MTTPPDLDRLTLIAEDDTEFDLWTSCQITDTFLDPCQSMTLSVAAEDPRFGLVQRLRPGSEFLVRINDNPVLGGFLDSVAIRASHGGVTVDVTGRDVLAPVVDSHVNPRLAVKKTMSVIDMAQLVFLDEFALPLTIFPDDADVDNARNLALGRQIKTKPRKTRRSRRDPLQEIYPKPNESGWQYFSRFAHRAGYHAWAAPDGKGVLMGGPTYEQEPCGQLTLLLGGRGAGNTIEEARFRHDNTAIPSHVYVRGKGSRPGDKSNPIGYAVNEAAPFFKPYFVTDNESSSKDHADAVARFVLGKAIRQGLTYEVTVRGFTAPGTNAVYTVDTVLDVKDEACGVDGPMWVEKRTFRKNRQGTFTDLTLIPFNTLLLDYYVEDSPPPPPEPAAARKAMPKGKTADKPPPPNLAQLTPQWFRMAIGSDTNPNKLL